MRRWIAWLVAGLLIVSVMGCFRSDEETFDKSKEIKLRVYMNVNPPQETFEGVYGQLLRAEFPNLKVEVIGPSDVPAIPDADLRLQEVFENGLADLVLLISMDEYVTLADKGWLQELDPLIERDGFDTSGMYPPVLEALRHYGGGKLYALAESFDTNALLYNKDLFDKYGIPLPEDRMSWDEVLQLAQRFPSDGDKNTRIFGYSPYTNSEFPSAEAVFDMAETEGLKIADWNTGRLTMDSPGWRRIIERAVQAYSSGAVRNSEQYGDLNHPFFSGRVAMTVAGYGFMKMIPDNMNWQLATAPVDPENRNRTNGFSLSFFFVMNKNAANPDAAWEIIKYMNSEKYGKLAAVERNAPMTRMNDSKEWKGRDLSAFYELSPTYPARTSGTPSFQLYYKLLPLVQEELDAAINDGKSVEAAVKRIAEEGQVLMDLVLSEQEQKRQQVMEELESKKAQSENNAGTE